MAVKSRLRANGIGERVPLLLGKIGLLAKVTITVPVRLPRPQGEAVLPVVSRSEERT